MKRLIFVFLLFPALALADPPQSPSASALGMEVGECIMGRAVLRDRIAALEAEITKLKASAPKEDPKK